MDRSLLKIFIQWFKMNKMEYISIFGLVSVFFLIIRVDAKVKESIKPKIRISMRTMWLRGDKTVLKHNQGKEVQLSMDKSSGFFFLFNKTNAPSCILIIWDVPVYWLLHILQTGSGFESKNHYSSGFFQIRMKLPPKDIDTSGVVTAFFVPFLIFYSSQNIHFHFTWIGIFKSVNMFCFLPYIFVYRLQLTSKGNTQDELDFEFLGNKQGKPILLQTYLFTNGKGDREQKIVTWFDPLRI